MVHSNINTMLTELHFLYFFCFLGGRGTTLYYILYTFSVLRGDGGERHCGWLACGEKLSIFLSEKIFYRNNSRMVEA